MNKDKSFFDERNACIWHDDGAIHRPLKAYAEITELLSPHGTPITFMKGQRIPLFNKEKKLYILKNGYASYRYFSNDNTLTYIFSPFIIGIMGIFETFMIGFFRAESTVEALGIDITTFEQLLNSEPILWRTHSEIVSFTFQRLLLRDVSLSKKKTQEIVRIIILELMNQPDVVRCNITASQYILDRLPISRSLVMDILSKLKRDKSIIMNRGHLIEVNNL